MLASESQVIDVTMSLDPSIEENGGSLILDASYFGCWFGVTSCRLLTCLTRLSFYCVVPISSPVKITSCVGHNPDNQAALENKEIPKCLAS